MDNSRFKFRYWDSFNGVMQYCTTRFKDYLSKFFIEYDAAQQGDNNPILMQYTGLKDKEGKEIYEGDIVKCLDDYIYHPSERCLVVVYGSCGFRLKGGKEFGYYATLEVLGNLYEHPHLMKQEIR